MTRERGIDDQISVFQGKCENPDYVYVPSA